MSMLTHSLGNLQMPSTKSKGRYQLTLEQKEEFTTSFQLFDTDGKGAIDLHELKVLMRALGFNIPKREVVALVREIDPTNHGMVSFDTYLEVMTDMASRRDPLEEMKKAFLLFAGDKDVISVQDLRRVSKQLGEKMSEDELAAMVAEFDRDGDGCINEEEFLQIMKGSGTF
ncbi:centrin 3 [Nannochloropsis gaditana CCMP526]|uniref:Centrin 3 n=1 Tax=Nannochloropsis gaditana TaxID=72520 RepID=W7TWU8_9STRA|nr:centrin 3 [Nannochloropsis gaditana CCMP526]EKU22709.1 centrin 3 [Nannochloropsis gaditana CCMP526]EWM27953.1 centrin 3 [Nannochloropsis gaditana]|eukprot:XP_005853651.1 centrin 3 [Nannochloropsis gaditana CCMP526]